jgi:hypothetical protein
MIRMIMSAVGHGGEGDVGQRIRDEILAIQASQLTHLKFNLSILVRLLLSTIHELCFWVIEGAIFVGICRETMTVWAE